MDVRSSRGNNSTLAKRDRSSRKTTKRDKAAAVKVVYISTPMKVKTSASRFRSLVQELTGRHSDIARIMEENAATDFEVFPDHCHVDLGFNPSINDDVRSPPMYQYPAVNSVDESPTSSESAAEHFDDHQVFGLQVDEQLQAMFPMDLFLNLNSSDLEVDVLGSYDAL